VLTIGMMLAWLGYPEIERTLTRIVIDSIEARACTQDVGGELGTRAAGAWIIERISK
jgi:3-isopropylmalate dehydrogenase